MNGLTWLGNGSVSAVSDLNWQIAGTGDFNRDGWPDILWRYNGTGGYNTIWYMKGVTHASNATVSAVTDLNWKIGGIGDFNRDGWPDILWRRFAGGGENVIWYMNGATHSSSGTVSAVTDFKWQIAGTGDFNRDGWPDILWRRYPTGENVIWFMRGALHTSNQNLSTISDANWRIENH
jgi:hypothetical protein